MKTIHEAVDLPDATSQPLVHPLDLADARKPFVIAWWLSVLALPTVFFGIAATLWVISNNYVTPVLVPVVIVVGAIFARKHFESEAWAHIPRKRHDLGRRMPVTWSIAKAAISALTLLTGLIVLTSWIAGHELTAEVSAYIVGMGAGVVLLMIFNLLWTLLTPARLAKERVAPQLFSLVVVAAALGYGYVILREHSGAGSWETVDVFIGAAIMIGIQALWWLSKLWPARHSAEDPTSA